IAQALNLIINLTVFRLPDGRDIRRVKEVNFVTGGVEGEMITHEPIFAWKTERGKPEYTGHLEYTEAAPQALIRKLEERVPNFNWQRDIHDASFDSQ
ncbi:MAG TPA: hypothetical protein VGK87_09500, partial [Anaerolineae bacterium]